MERRFPKHTAHHFYENNRTIVQFRSDDGVLEGYLDGKSKKFAIREKGPLVSVNLTASSLGDRSVSSKARSTIGEREGTRMEKGMVSGSVLTEMGIETQNSQAPTKTVRRFPTKIHPTS